ncbi:MAG TPA: CPXCG motif-containing cysteine-rich protein [Planctomycetota bacterium]|nr:CPXCG motif-containing cysteine-rich protein [Planctomycetota bacterium]
MDDDTSYTCAFCGEEIVVTVDLSAGEEQEYVEDCPVCCRPHLIRVTIEDDGHVTVRAEAEAE